MPRNIFLKYQATEAKMRFSKLCRERFVYTSSQKHSYVNKSHRAKLKTERKHFCAYCVKDFLRPGFLQAKTAQMRHIY